MLWRTTKWLFLLCVVLFAVVFVVMPLVASTEKGRAELARILSRALDRPVTIGALKIGIFYSSVEVRDVAVGNPEGYPAGSLFRAGGIDLDAKLAKLLDGEVVGAIRGRGFDIHVLRQGGGSNLDGLGGEGEKDAEGGPAPDMDLTLELEDSRVTIEDLDKKEKVVLDGVSLSMRLTNRAGQPDTGLVIRVASIDKGGLAVRDLRIDAKHKGEWLELEKLTANLPGRGVLKGSGRARVHGGDEWAVSFATEKVGLDDDLMPIVSALYPFAAQAKGQLTGTLDAHFDVSGRGLTWEGMKPTLAGTGRVTLTDLTLPQDSLFVALAAAAGRPESAFPLNSAGAEFGLEEGWMKFNRLSASGKESRYDLEGRVSLDGRLELSMDLLPMIRTFTGEKRFAEVKKYTDRLPVRIRGTTAKPEWKAPDIAELARGALEKTVEKELGGLLDKINRKKK